MIKLVEIDENNWRTSLRVAKEQEEYVCDKATIMARAYAFRKVRSKAYFICDNEVAVGMCLYYDCEELAAYDLNQIFIDERFQGKGYGSAATKMMIDDMKQDGKYSKAILCYIEGNEAAKKLYERFNFVETERDEDEIIMELTW